MSSSIAGKPVHDEHLFIITHQGKYNISESSTVNLKVILGQFRTYGMLHYTTGQPFYMKFWFILGDDTNYM